MVIYLNSAASMWFEIWEIVDPGQQNFDFSGQISEKFRFFQVISQNFDFSRQILKNFDFSRQIFEEFQFFSGNLKKIDFPGKTCSFSATSGKITLFLFKSHHFRTYFLYMIRYNNISRPVLDPCDSPRKSKAWMVATPQPPGLTPLSKLIHTHILCYRSLD